jgi:hypothetical protein
MTFGMKSVLVCSSSSLLLSPRGAESDSWDGGTWALKASYPQ